jgi:S-DNA-T family DNA segregation ATPase FtsK/SpoIIIE
MAKAMTEKKLTIQKASPEKQVILSYIYAIIAVIAFTSLFDYNPESYHSVPGSENTLLLGQFGVIVARYILSIFGISAWLLPLIFGVLSFLSHNKTHNKEKLIKFSTLVFSMLCICILANIRDIQVRENGSVSLFDPTKYEHGAGGSVGAFFYSGLPIHSSSETQVGGFLKLWLGSLGSIFFSVISLLFCLSFHFSFAPIQRISTRIKLFQHLHDKLVSNQIFEDKVDAITSEEKIHNEIIPTKRKWNFPWQNHDDAEDPLFGDVSKNITNIDATPKDNITSTAEVTTKKSPAVVENVKKDKDIPEEISSESNIDSKESNDIANVSLIKSPEIEPSVGMEGFKVVRAAKTEKAVDLFPERKGDYHFPPMELLMEPPEEEAIGDEDHILKAKRLQDTLKEFKIEVEMGEVHTGPVITRYDMHPAAGVRVEKIANLDKNLAMALKADSVRILAPVPGKGCVGIEVPNATPMPVCMKEILQSKAWHEAGAEIPIVLGKEASGRPLVADLTKMPHLLVAGSTGSGKTVCINAIIASLCYHSSPEDVRFIMVDPKIVEMKVYNDLPHMLIPVVTDPKKVPGALKWLLIEMERRYQIFSKIGVRNIAGFNAKILKDKVEREKAQLLDAEMTPEERAALNTIEVPRDDDALEIPENKLPYIVCIIDELADLMMVAQADVETGIARLAQLARAAGIHLIIATQRPSVNVITGVIKANLPSRISFRVASYRDSQTILDGKGAEALIGKGDMLFIPPGSSTFARAQGAFVSDDEINGIVDFLKINGPPQIIEEVREQIESAGEDDVLGGNDDSDDDPMTRKAIEVIRSTKRASTSNLQRKLSIGYNRAARIMDDLEDRGLVGPDVAGQGREILMDL